MSTFTDTVSIPAARHDASAVIPSYPAERAARVSFYGEPNSPSHRSFREYEDDDEIPFILSEGRLPVKFRSDDQDLDYEGALRFYFEDGHNELTKAVRLTNKTSVDELIPTLVDKFSLPPAIYALYDVQEDEAVYLYPEECPLARAISARKVPRFVLRRKSSRRPDESELGEDTINPVSSINTEAAHLVWENGDSTFDLTGVPTRADGSAKLNKPNKKLTKKQRKSKKGSESSESGNSTQMKQQNGLERKKSGGSVEKQPSSLQQAEEENLGASAKDKDKKKKKKSSKPAKSKRSGSFSNMFQKHKSDGTMMFTPELSTYQVAPGILKVFGDHVSPGSNYKAVRVSTISTAQEVVRMALERYGFESCDPHDYVLCDVVGHFSTPEDGKKEVDEEAKWITDYVRAVSDNEKPLVVQSLWKPAGERLRRFELRLRTEIESSCFFINTADTMGRSMSENSLDGSDGSSLISGNDGSTVRSTSPSEKGDVFHAATALSPPKSAEAVVSEQSPRAPLYVPFLLLIRGFKSDLDFLIYKLAKETSIVGPGTDKGSPCDIILHAADILLPHCWIHKKVQLNRHSTETNIDDTHFQVSVEPASGAEISINGVPVDKTTALQPGQLLQLGKSYIFLFKDPTQIKDSQLKISWPTNDVTRKVDNAVTDISVKKSSLGSTSAQNVVQVDKSIQVDLIPPSSSVHDSSGESESSDDEVESPALVSRQSSANLAPRKPVEKSQLQFSYEYKDEDDLLHAIIDVAEDISGFKLTPAYLFMMTLEHSAAVFTEIQTRKLLLKLSSGLQGIAWEKTKEIGKQGSLKDEDGLTILTRLLPELRPILFWMSIALEMLHFLQCKLSNYLLPREHVATSKDALLTADEELLTVLEEVIMFTFQQTVYHLTKVLYVALPAVIDTNPFQTDEEMDNDSKAGHLHPSISKIVQIFSDILNTTSQLQLHPQITSQLFAYLFFFSNASLFNSLMEKGAGGKFYRWTKGVQMRGNVEAMEEWASQHGLHSQFDQYMSKFTAAVDVLSTPKAQLMQMDWSTMRIDFAALNAAQLQQLLGEYQLSGKPRPRGWFPPPEEVEAALRSSDILESFATHPPLMLPASSFQLDLNKVPDDKSFGRHLEAITKRFSRNPEAHHVDLTPNAKRQEAPKRSGKPTSVESVALTSEPVKTRTDSRASSAVIEDSITTDTVARSYTEPAEEHPPPRPVQPTVEYQPTPIHRLKHEGSPSHPVDEPAATQVLVATDKNADQTGKLLTSIGTPETIQVAPRKPRPSQASPAPVKTVTFKEQAETDYGSLLDRAQSLIAGNAETDSDNEEALGDGSDSTQEAEGLNGDDDDAVFFVELERGVGGLGLGLIDGKFTPLKNNGIYIRTVLPNTPASKDPRIRVGDRILAVNGTSLVGSDYGSAMELIKKSGDRLTFLIASSDDATVDMIHKSSC